MQAEPDIAAPDPLEAEFLRRLDARDNLESYCRHVLQLEPAAHHKLLIHELEEIESGRNKNLMFLLPPGAAKSTYGSVCFPTWFLGKAKSRTILACSYSKDLIASFGKRCRNIVDLFGQEDKGDKTLPYMLKSDSKAADEWETTNGGRFFCAGVNAGIAGHRAHLGLIDDPIGSAEDAASTLFREKLWVWYWNDFMPRLHPSAPQVIIANRRHEEDLVGRLLALEGEKKNGGKWKVVKLPLIAVEDDPLGRQPGDLLWPEFFNETTIDKARKSTDFSGLYQQEPSPEEGDFFKRDWLVEYERNELPRELVICITSDHAISTKQTADKTCIGVWGIDSDGIAWLLDLHWEREGSEQIVAAMLRLGKKHKPTLWAAEKGHISKSILPFLRKQMIETNTFFNIEEVTPVRDKMSRAQSIQGRLSMKRVRFPRSAAWWPQAKHEMLMFPNGKHDDFVDMCSLLGLKIDRVLGIRPTIVTPEFKPDSVFEPTFKWLKDSAKWKKRQAAKALLADK